MTEAEIEKLFEESAEFLAGTCLKTPEDSLRFVAEFLKIEEEITDELVLAFELYLENIEQKECMVCGWWGYPGETCECEDDLCDECCQPTSECECDS